MELLFGLPSPGQRYSILIHSGWVRRPVACHGLTRLVRRGTLREASEMRAAKGVIGRALFQAHPVPLTVAIFP
jgi:hypothetical protein